MSITIRPGTKLSYGIRVRVPLPPVAYFVDSAVGIINEGDTMIFNVSTTAVPDGTVLYWKVENETTTDARFAAVSGSVTVSAGAGSFGITPLADLQTEGTTTFHVTLRTGSVGGTVVWTTGNKAIGDTSLTPPVPGAGRFVEASSQSLQVAQPSYTAGGAGYGATVGTLSTAPIFKGSYPQPQVGWTAIGSSGVGPYRVTLTSVTDGGDTWILNWSPQFATNLYKGENWTLYDPTLAPFVLGTTWTIEFWINANNSSLVAQGGIWGLFNQVGWSTTNAIVVALSDAKLVFLSRAGTANDDVRYTEPPPGIWTHVAIVNNAGTQKVFYNGIEQTKVSGTFGTASYTNPWAPLYIGRLGPENGGTLDGKITNVRITDQAQYASTFTPALVPVNIPGHTRFLWTPSDQALITDTGDSVLTITNSNGVTLSTDYPNLTTTTRYGAVFDSNDYYKIGTAGTTPWGLGTTWTIEWWQKATNLTVSNGQIYSVMGQFDSQNVIDIYYQNGYLHAGNGRPICVEPPAGVWTHVAMVTTGGSTQVYYNGLAQSVSAVNYNLTNSGAELYIGCRGSNLFQQFIGKLTNIRICSTAKYLSNFDPTVLPVRDVASTPLLFNPSSRKVQDEGDNGLAVVSYGVTYSTDYPQAFIGLAHPYPGGTLGNTYCVAANPRFAEAMTIPIGARITSNIPGFGTRTVTNLATIGGDRVITYDPTGLTGFTSVTDTFNFFW